MVADGYDAMIDTWEAWVVDFDHASFDAVVAYDEVVTISEPEGGVQFQWVLAQR
jgi:hypothetical protein